MHSQNSIENWVKKAADGDQRAQRYIYDELSGVLYSICLRYMGNEDDAKDVFQEGFVRLLDNLKSFRFDGSFEGWAKRIMVNMALTHLRKRKPMADVEMENHEEVAYDQDVLSKMGADDLMRLIRELPDGYREVSELVATTRFRRDQPLELLTLSACETAADDEDAALGLAGVALRAGARSALATLWPVNDEATARLVDTFYRELAQPGQTRAGALRAAQQKVREQPRFAHPGYWAAFLMISSWM